MKPLSIGLAATGLLALAQPGYGLSPANALLAAAILISAATTYRSASLSSFLRIFAAIFSAEALISGLCLIAGRGGLWPFQYATKLEALPLTFAIFSMIVCGVARLGTVRQIMQIADRYFLAVETGQARVWPFRPFAAPERRVATALVVALVLINQAEVAILIRLNFFNGTWFNAIQARNAAVFWQQLLFVFTPWAFTYVTMAVVEFFMRSMLVIRWRRWLTNHFVSRWLTRHNHYRISLIAGQTDNPDQRISEDIFPLHQRRLRQSLRLFPLRLCYGACRSPSRYRAPTSRSLDSYSGWR